MNDFTRVIRDCERAGLRYIHGRKHGKLLDPRTGRSVSVSNTPSCTNAHRNVLRDVRRFLGVDASPRRE
jgi:hypothetical protein